MINDVVMKSIFLIVSVLQAVYFKYSPLCEDGLTFIKGLDIANRYAIPYFDICVFYTPIIVVIIYFSNLYNQYMKGYGILLLVRNCNIKRLVFNMCLKCGVELLLLLLAQFVLNLCILDVGIVKAIERYILEFIIYYLIIIIICMIQFLLSSYFDEGIVSLMVNLYVVASSFVLFFDWSIINTKIFFPGIVLQMDRYISEMEKIDVFIWDLFIVLMLYILTVVRCKNKDYL